MLKNSLRIQEEKTKEITAVSVLYVIKNQLLIYVNFSFDFLGLNNVYFSTFSWNGSFFKLH
jgi:hypothetical protein